MEENQKISVSDIRALELHEAETWKGVWLAAGPELVDEVGISYKNIGSGVVTAVSSVDILAWNSINGLGIGKPITESQIDEIIDFYRQSGAARCFLQLCPQAEPSELVGMLERKGFSFYNNWVKLYRATDNIPVPVSGVDVRQISPGADAELFGRMLATSFEWPESLGSWIAGCVEQPGWRYYLAFIDGTPAATAATYVSYGLGWLDMASTLPEFRGRGAQSALIAKRIADCAAEGVRLLHVEAAEEKPGKPAVSASNLKRFGFKEAYLRPNYIQLFNES